MTTINTGISHLRLDAELSCREYEICEQVILGHTHIETSTIFYRSYFTIINTIQNAFKKTGARNITELGVWYWCKKFAVSIDFSEPKRKVIAMLFLLLFGSYELAVSHDTLRTSRTEIRECRTRRNDDNAELLTI